MKNLIQINHLIFLFLMVSGIALLPGCATNKKYSFTPVTVPHIVQMSKDKVSSKDIINEIKKSHTAYTLKASEYAKLQKAGVPDSVVNFMQETQLNMIRHDQQRQDAYYCDPGFGGYWDGTGFGWPYRYGYWGFDFGPAIIFRGGGGGHIHRGGGGHSGGGNLR